MKTRHRSTSYRARRKERHAQRRVRAADRHDAQIMLERTPGYVTMLETQMAQDNLFDLAQEWENAECTRETHDYRLDDYLNDYR